MKYLVATGNEYGIEFYGLKAFNDIKKAKEYFESIDREDNLWIGIIQIYENNKIEIIEEFIQ
jgi:hypothetical protein